MNNCINDYIKYLVNHMKEREPLAKLFKTDSFGYIYDTGTSKVIQCEDMEFNILKNLFDKSLEENSNWLIENFGDNRFLQGLMNIKNAIESENILKSKKSGDFYSFEHFEDLENQINNNLNQITIELTEECNLRCGYCIYNDEFKYNRNHGNKKMTSEIAKEAIRYVSKHANKDEVSITFYGGEPLIQFDLIKQCVQYSNEIIKDKFISYSMTTNLLLMTPEIASYLASVDNFCVACSLDGPQYIHDSYRKDLNGNGSFERAIKGLKYLVDAFGESAKEKIIISMVYAPPYYQDKLEQINNFFDDLEWFPNEIQKVISYPTADSVSLKLSKEKYKEFGIEFQKNDDGFSMREWAASNYINSIKSKNTVNHCITKNEIEHQLLKIHNRIILDEPNGQYPLNSCCIPASRKLYVTTDGNFLLCERLCSQYVIGNVFSGVDIQKVKKVFVNEYSSRLKEKCTSCWAVRLCPLCYAQYYTDSELEKEKREIYCKKAKEEVLYDLQLYHKCMEVDSNGLQHLNDLIKY